MGAILDALHRLQRIEDDLGVFRAKEEAIRRRSRTAQQQIDKYAAEYNAHLREVAKCQSEIDHDDLAIRAREDSMNRHRQALNNARTNKDYAAILTALNTEKADNSKSESRVLEMMARKEELQAKSAKYEDERARLEKQRRKFDDQLEAYREETREQTDRLKKERQEAANDLPPSALLTFERVAAKLGGEAMAEVEKLNTRSDDHLCGGCNMSIPLEHVSRLRSLDELLLCGSCGRILYLRDSK